MNRKPVREAIFLGAVRFSNLTAPMENSRN